MRLLLISYYNEELAKSAAVQRIGHLVKFLRSSGHDVSFLTCSYDGNQLDQPTCIKIHDPSYNLQRSGWRRISWLAQRLAVELLNRAGIYTSVYRRWQKRSLALSARIGELSQPQIIMASYPPVEDLEIGLHLARSYHIPLIADFRDGLLFEPIESGRLRRFACVRQAYAKIERRVAAADAGLVTVSEPLSDYFRRTYGPARVITVANGFDPEENGLPLPEITMEQGCFHIVHSGRFALSDAGCNIAPLVKALNGLLAARPELARTLRLHLLGDLARREKRMLAGLARRGVVRIYGTVGRLQALAFQRRADLLLLVTAPARSSVATTKIFEYLQARRPVLALTGRTFAAEIIERTHCGWVVSAQSVLEIQKTLELLINDPDLEQKVDLSSAAIAEYSFPTSLARLNDLLLAINNQNNK